MKPMDDQRWEAFKKEQQAHKKGLELGYELGPISDEEALRHLAVQDGIETEAEREHFLSGVEYGGLVTEFEQREEKPLWKKVLGL